MSFPGVPASRGRSIDLALGHIVTMLRAGKITRTPLRKMTDLWVDREGARRDTQRPQRFLTELFRHNAPTPLLMREVGEGELEVLDGCNRLDAIEAFFASELGLPESMFYTDRAWSKQVVTFAAMAPEVQRELMSAVHFPVTVYPPDTPEPVLRRLVHWPHMVGQALEGEELLLLNDIPIMELIAEVNLASIKMQKKGPWRVKRQAMIISWIRIAAIVFDNNLHLSNDLGPCRQWVLDRAHAAPPPPFQADVFRQVCKLALEVYCAWSVRTATSKARAEKLKANETLTEDEARHLTSMVGSLAVFVDYGWLFCHYGPTPEVYAAVEKMHAGLFVGDLQNERSASLKATRKRREQLSRVFAALLPGATETNRLARSSGSKFHNDADEPPPRRPAGNKKKKKRAAPPKTPRAPPAAADAVGAAGVADVDADGTDGSDADEVELAIREVTSVRPSKKPRIAAGDAEAHALLALAGDVGPYDAVDLVTGDLVTGDLVTGDLVTGDLPPTVDDADERPFE